MMQPMHGRLVAQTQGPLTFEGIITEGEVGHAVTFRVNLSTVRVDPTKLPADVTADQVKIALTTLYPGLIVVTTE